MVKDMTADKTFLALGTIIARRSTPAVIISDQAPQFHAIKEAFEIFYTHEWKWKFLPSHSPWMGGAYERMIRLVKDAIYHSFHNVQMTDYVLRTSLAEICAVLNARPISVVTHSADDVEPLTPKFFLHSYHHEIDETELQKETNNKTPSLNVLRSI